MMPLHRFIATAASVSALMASMGSQAQALNEEAAAKAIESVVAEHQLYATCLSLEPSALPLVQESWRRDVAQAADTLKRLKASPGLMARFMVMTDASRLLDDSMRLSAAIALCHKNEATVRKFHEFGQTRLAAALEAVAKRAGK